MKLTVSEAISTIRKKVSFHSVLIILLIILILIGAMILRAIHFVDGKFYDGAILPFHLTLLFALYMVFRRRGMYMNVLRTGDPLNSISNLENRLQVEYTSFRNTDMVRLIGGIIITIAMLLFLFTKPDSYITGALFATFIGLISLSMLKSWTLMRDGINLQDLKHYQRDQTSEIS